MLDMSMIREQTDRVKQALRDRAMTFDVDGLLALDARRRELIGRGEALRSERNTNSNSVATFRKEGKDATSLIERTRQIGGFLAWIGI